MTTNTQTPDPVIEKAGTAEIDAPNACIWKTDNGANSTLTISNESNANVLKFTVSGAPVSGISVTLNGESQSDPNGVFSIPENEPDFEYIAYGDFKGTEVTITNITNTANNATASLVAEIAG